MAVLFMEKFPGQSDRGILCVKELPALPAAEQSLLVLFQFLLCLGVMIADLAQEFYTLGRCPRACPDHHSRCVPAHSSSRQPFDQLLDLEAIT